jgi:hypothetical protein
MEVGGNFVVLILLANVWAVLNIFQSRVGTGKEALWIVLVLILPLLGLIIWYVTEPREQVR